jgi:RHS repeat-associated protein
VADTDASGNLLRSYAWGPGIDNLLAVTVYTYPSNSLQPSASSYYAVKDRLGSVHALVDAQGQVVESYSYDAWGNLLSHSRTNELTNFSLRFLFQGREFSSATGLYNFRARWYDPQSGRWLSKDPIGLEGGLNLYAFCGDDPVNCTDPDGTDVIVENTTSVRGWHQRITVSNANGSYSQSFGLNGPTATQTGSSTGSSADDPTTGGKGGGIVYPDTGKKTKEKRRFKTTPEEDCVALRHLRNDLWKRGEYNWLTHNCRWYSNQKFDEIVGIIKGRRGDK